MSSLPPAEPSELPVRRIGLWGATSVGVGAIVGGGILVLAGVAFRETGPSAIVAFGLNGLLAALTAMSFAEMSTSFPESGGAYTFAKKVLSVRAAFAVGWVLWFAYIVAATLYALGFASYAAEALTALLRRAEFHEQAQWLARRELGVTLGVLATAGYTLGLLRKATGGGQFATVGKVLVFVVLVVAGLWALSGQPGSTTARRLQPFFAEGGLGLVAAMGFTFIALQGFDLIAAIAGEVREPRKTIPRAMGLSLGAALVIYLPLLLVMATVGVPEGSSIKTMSESDAGTVMARSARQYLGPTGFWLVAVAAVLSTLSALQANLLAASRVALSMAKDRTLPAVLGRQHAVRNTPVMAIYATALTVVSLLLMIPSVAAAGAAASLIFLVLFAFAHWTAILARRRAAPGVTDTFQTPWFPAIPLIGLLGCLGLALFQAVAVPSAGGIAALWLGLGVLLYFGLFAARAETADALAEAGNPELARLRGRTPLVLVPVANPHSAPGLVAVASALAPPVAGKVLLLLVMRPPKQLQPEQPVPGLTAAQQVLGQALTASMAQGHRPETLVTIASDPWEEIQRVARARDCASILLGMTSLTADKWQTDPLEALLNRVDCDVTVLRAPEGWNLGHCEKILVPVGGRGGHDGLRARLLGSLCRTASREVTFLRVMPTSATERARVETKRRVAKLAEDETPGKAMVELVRDDDVVEAVVRRAAQSDLMVLGLQRQGGRRRFGDIALEIAARAPCATLMISRH